MTFVHRQRRVEYPQVRGSDLADGVTHRETETVKATETVNDLGRRGEQAAEKFLTERGMHLIERNWHNGKHGEVDLILADGQQTVFVEVKTRSTANCFEVVDRHKVNQVSNLAIAWLAAQPVWRDYRIDVVLVTIDELTAAAGEGSATIRWWRGADR